MAKYRVVWERVVEANGPDDAALAAAIALKPLTSAPLVYTDDYRVVALVDLSKPAGESVTVITPEAGPLAW